MYMYVICMYVCNFLLQLNGTKLSLCLVNEKIKINHGHGLKKLNGPGKKKIVKMGN